MKEEIGRQVAMALQKAKQEEARLNNIDIGDDGVCRNKAPWAQKPLSAQNKAHMANSDRPQKEDGVGWVNESGERVWTHAKSGITFSRLVWYYQ